MNLYLISQTANNDYDTYDAAVVCAPDEATAKMINPSDSMKPTPEGSGMRDGQYGSWTQQNNVKVEFIGMAHKELKQGVILASFNAG